MSESMPRRRAPSSVVSILAVATLVGVASAAEAKAGEGADGAPTVDGLEEIIVTASLRHEAAGKLPASVTVLDAPTLAAAGVQHLQDVLLLVPDLNWASGTSRPRYYQLRGIGETDQWQGAPNPSVGFLIDGIDFSGVGMPATLFDTGQVEVLRGPQGAIQGANALAGLINVRTRDATPRPEARSELQLADYGTWSAGAVAGGALLDDDSAAWRVVAQKFRSDGFRRNVYLGRDATNGYDEGTLRARLRGDFGERLHVALSTLWVDLDNGYDAFALDNSRITRSDQPGRDAQLSRGASLSIDYDAPWFTLRSISAAARSSIRYSFDGDWTADPGNDFTSRFVRAHDTTSEDLRLVSAPVARPGDWSWLAGAYALRVREANDQLDLYDGDVYRAITSRYGATSLALYGQVDWQPDAADLVSLGLRCERRSANYSDTDGSRFAPRDDMWGVNLSLRHLLDDARQVYLTLARGYKAGGFNIGPLVPADRRQFAPEFLYSLELGVKGRWAAGRLGADVALFRMQRRDVQVSASAQVDPADPLSFIYITDNAARGVNQGVEVTLDWHATERLRLTASGARLITRYVGYELGGVSFDGRAQAHAPGHQFALAADWRDPRGWFARADVQGMGAFYYSDSNDQRSHPYVLVNARVGYDAQRWGVNFWGRNLFDRFYTQRGFFFGNEPPDFPDKLYVQPGDPRQYGVSFRFSR
jgi:outer membrane receptor protein involved in Fe transport